MAAALSVAVYVTKVPVPFVNKGQTRSADQDAAEAKKNKGWDPNAPLYGKNPAKAAAPAPAAAAAAAAAPVPPPVPPPVAATPGAPAAVTRPEPLKPEVAKADAGKPDASGARTDAKTDSKASPSADPLGDLARAKSSSSGAEPFSYFVQVGAYRTAEDAEAQRAKLSLGGVEARVTEREQSGRVVFRVRAGPFDKKEDADRIKEKLESSGLETALVRVQR